LKKTWSFCKWIHIAANAMMKKLEQKNMRILCILNPIAGGGKIAERVTSALHEIFRQSGITYDLVTTQQKGDGTTLSRKAVEEGYTVVVAIGGDGTVNEVATGLVGTSLVLGIIPVGSGNGLARGLRVPLNYWDACRLILRGQSREIDVGQVCDRYFFATSGIGFDAHIGKIYNEKSGRSRGFLLYCQFAITEFFNYESQEVVLTCNGKTFQYIPFVLTVANVEQYGGGAIIAPGAIPDDGLFNISIVPQSHPFQVLTHLPKLFAGTIDTFPHFESHETDSLTITRPSPGPVHVDGEPFIAGEFLEYTLLPHALHVQVYEKAFEKMKRRKGRKVSITSADYVFDTLEKLACLKEKGIITEEEFKAQKQKLLARL
jgi:diacylglycerol kinase (ATP)